MQSIRLFCLAILALLAPQLQAQRETAKAAWKKHEAIVDYGPVAVGNHGLHALPVGGDWRLGEHEATTMQLSVPLVAGDFVAAPGSYRVKILRKAEDSLDLLIEGAGLAIGADAPNVSIPGELSKPKKPSKRLEITWRKADSKAKQFASELQILFGADQLAVPLVLLDAKAESDKVFVVDAFAWDAELMTARIEKKLPTPIATVRPKRKPKSGEIAAYNLVVDDAGAKLIPMMSAPTESMGFGEVTPPKEADIVAGTIEWTDLEQADGERLELVRWVGEKEQIECEFRVGARSAIAKFAMPEKAR